jgi:hypothetical protein
MRITFALLAAAAAMISAAFFLAPRAADACAGLIGSNGSVQLGRTTTLAGYSGGVEHYVTSFEFRGGGAEFGSLIPLPGVPTKVERGGDWTLQRLEKEAPFVPPPQTGGALTASGGGVGGATVLQEVRIDALDLTVLEGGGESIAEWAKEHGFSLPPDAPGVLDFYARRSPIFLAAVFDSTAADERGQTFGDGTPVHITIPTDNPWVPLRILGLGKQPDQFVQADIFLLTDIQPLWLPHAGDGLQLAYYGEASDSLLNDLRSDAGMGWVPTSAWLTKLQLADTVRQLRYDLAVDASGEGMPSYREAGLIPLPNTGGADSGASESWVWPALAVLAVILAHRGARSVRVKG